MFEDGGVPGSRKGACLGQLDVAPWERDGNHLPGGHDHLPGGGGTWCSRRSGLPTLCRGQSQLFCRMRVLNVDRQVVECSGVQDCFCELAPVSFSSHAQDIIPQILFSHKDILAGKYSFKLKFQEKAVLQESRIHLKCG